MQTSATAATTDNAGSNHTANRRFKRSNRLPDAASYGRVFQTARRSKDGLFTVLYRRRGTNEARLGLAISKKHCRSSVERNRLKRIVRESFRHHKRQLHGIDIVVLNQPTTHRAENAALFASLEHHWKRCEAASRANVVAAVKPDRG